MNTPHPSLRTVLATALISLVLPMQSLAADAAWQNPPLQYRMNKNVHNFPLKPDKQKAWIQTTLAEGWGGFATNVPFRHYLSDEGMEATKRFCETAKAKGMELWLYDENGYPSGNAGDLVIKENPAWECMGLFFKEAIATKDQNQFKMPPGKPVMIVAFPIKQKGKIDFAKSINLMNQLDNPQAKWTVPPGKWKIFAVTKAPLYKGFQAEVKDGAKIGARYPSLMMPEVTDAFLRITHEKYAEHFGKDLGKYFTSTFTDEPSLMAVPFHHCKHNHIVIPWKEILSDTMKERYGYQPEEKLVELYFGQGPKGQKVRYQYFQTVGDLIAKNYFGKIKTWCEEHQLRSGGHLLLEESMIAHVLLYGNIMQCFRAMHAPGIDILSCLPENMPVHSPKLASSAAELEGHTLVMSEPCPVADRQRLGGKEPPTESVRGHLNQLLLGGVTDFNCYLRLSNADAAKKREINTYVGRINMLLQGGHTASDIGIVYPIESLWTKFIPRPHRVQDWKNVKGATPAANQIDQTFRNVSRFMYNRRWEYCYLDSQALIDSRVLDGKLVHGPLQFKVIVLPMVDTLPEKAWSRLLRFAKKGGKIIAIGKTPQNSDSHFPDTQIRAQFTKLFQNNPNVIFLPKWAPGQLHTHLNRWLQKPLQLAEETKPLRLAHKKLKGRDVFFVINDSKKPVHTNATFHTRNKLNEWDPATGKITPVSNKTKIYLKPYHGKIYTDQE